MTVKLDIEERLLGAFRELLTADADISAKVGERVYWYGDETHRADYPCILLNVPDSTVSGMMELGWYEVHLQILAAVYRPDDKNLAGLRELEGLIRGFVQQTDLPTKLTATRYATRWRHPLTVVDARYENDVADEEGNQTQIYAGISLAVTCAPHNVNEVRPQPNAETGSDAGTGEPIENNNQGETE